MQSDRSQRGVVLVVVSLTVAMSGCATAPELPMGRGIDEAGRALQLMQEREKELAALRAELAATRIAAAKQDAELHDLRTTVVQVRQENGESHQALMEAKRALALRDHELTTMKMERAQSVQASVPSGDTEHHLAALHHTVASLSQELATIKAAMAQSLRTPPAAAERPDELRVTAQSGQPSRHPRRTAGASDQKTRPGMIPAVHVPREDDESSRPSWITVQPGDSWWTLARKHHTTITALRTANGRVGDALTVGEALRLP
ncbi:MAG: LysM peptidoglycan-binding domain-containing protein [Nitrospira sp.]|nr:LysM peptidoglycan-binding domain-containing protein [Nitrospira sp.]